MKFYLSLMAGLLYCAGWIKILLGYIRHKNKLKHLGQMTAILGFGLHTLILGLSMQKSGTFMGQNYFELLSWTILLLSLLIWIGKKLNFVFFLGTSMSFFFYTSGFLLSYKLKHSIAHQTINFWFSLHIFSLSLSLSLLALAFGSSLIYLYMEHKIKTKSKLPSFSREMPSLTTCDRLNHLAIVWGFPIFSFSLLSGFIWASLVWAKLFKWDLKEILALVIWSFFAYLFHQRLALGWKGKKIAKLTIFIFILFLVSFIGISYLKNLT